MQLENSGAEKQNKNSKQNLKSVNEDEGHNLYSIKYLESQTNVSQLKKSDTQTLNFTFLVPNLKNLIIKNQSLFQYLIYKKNISYIHDYYQEKQDQGRMSNILVKSESIEQIQNTEEYPKNYEINQFHALIYKAIDEILTGQPGQMIVRSCIRHQNLNIILQSIHLYIEQQNALLQKLYENKEIYSQTNPAYKNRNPLFEQKFTIVQLTEISQQFLDNILFKQSQQSQIQLFAFSLQGEPYKHEKHYSVQLDEYTQPVMKLLYKQFLKSKISQFKPKIIILAYEVNETLKIEKQTLQFLTSKLKKLCHGRLIFVPLENIEVDSFPQSYSNPYKINFLENAYQINTLYCKNTMKEVIENSFSLLLECLNGCTEIKKGPYIKIDENLKIDLFQKVYPNFVKTKNEERSYQQQLKFFKLSRQKSKEISQGTNKFSIFDLNSSKIILLNLGSIEYNSQSIYFVDYKEAQLILINKEKIYLIKWNNSIIHNQEIQPYIEEIEECYNEDEVNFYYQNVLYKFFGFNQFGEWDNSIRIYDFYQNKWRRVEQGYCKQELPEYYINYNLGQQLAKYRVGFGVTVQSDSKLRKSKFILVGGYKKLEQQQFQYCLITEEIYFEDNLFYSRIYKKECYNQYFKEVKDPFILNYCDDQFAIFENNGRYQNSINNPGICSMKIQNTCKKKIQCERLQQYFGQQVKYMYYIQLINSKQVNYYQVQDKFYRFMLVDYNKSKYQQKELSDKDKLKHLGNLEGWKYLILNLYIDKEKQQFQFYHMEEFQNSILKLNLSEQCMFQNWVENIDDIELFQFQEDNYMYSLYYKNDEKTYQNRRFIFSVYNNEKNEEKIYNDYDEKVTVDYESQQLYIARCFFPSPTIIYIYQCPFIYFQDIKDTQRDLITKISMNAKLQIPVEEHHSLLALVQKGNKLIIRTTGQLIKINLQEWKICKQINQAIYLNVKQKLIPIYFKKKLILFYQVGQINKIKGKEKCKISFKYYIDINHFDFYNEIDIDQEGIIDISIIQITQIDDNCLKLLLQMMQHSQYRFYYLFLKWDKDQLRQYKFQTNTLTANKKIIKQLQNNGHSKNVLYYQENLLYAIEDNLFE